MPSMVPEETQGSPGHLRGALLDMLVLVRNKPNTLEMKKNEWFGKGITKIHPSRVEDMACQ